MTTFTALTTLTNRQGAEALGEAMERMDPTPVGVGVFEVEDGSGTWEVGAYFTQAPDETALAVLAAAFAARPFAVSKLPETDWVAHVRRELHPVEAGRFFLYGSHDADKVPQGVVPLLIEAATAFGTGHHGTTLGCMRLLDGLVSDGFAPQRVADIGCGTAVLAMAAAKVWEASVLASDMDAVAVQVAEANLVANGLEGRVRCLEAVGFDHPDIADGAPFDLIFANILKGPLLEMAVPMAAVAPPGGYAILSGLLNDQAAEIVTAYAAQGFEVVRSEEIGEWAALLLRKAH